jgi:RHS repeat-associated protein
MLRSPRLAVLLLAAITLPLAAQQFPSQQRGLTADTAYSSGELDSVNLFNGNLSLGVPLGQPYPVGPSFSLGFALHYNSKIWDHEEKTCQQSFPTQEVEYFLPVPDKLANAGLGWLLTPGRLLDPSTVTVQNPLNDGPNWIYVSADGGQHALYPRLHPGYPATPASGTLYSNDGTYLRHKELAGTDCRAPAGVSGICRIIEFPDGSRHEFRSYAPFNWRVVRMKDSFGNQIDVDYQFTPQGADQKWIFTDAHGRQPVVDFENGRVRWLRLPYFGAGAADWEFQYEIATIPRHRYTQLACTPPAPGLGVEVAFLKRIVRPDQSYFDFDYIRTDASTLSGVIDYLRYPTGGSLSWTYDDYGFPQEDHSGTSGPWSVSSGVASKTIADASGTIVGTFSYMPVDAGNPSGPGQTTAPCFHKVTLRDPLGQETENFFSSVENTRSWSYGLPYTYCDPDTGAYDDQAGSFLSQRIWSGAAGSSSLLRSVWVEYDNDGLAAPGDQNRNHRLRYKKVVYEDDGDRYVETINSDFDGLGHWRETLTQGSFGPSKTSVTSYRPGGGTLILDDQTSQPQAGNSFVMPAESDRWLFGTYNRSSVKQGSGAEIVGEACFDAQTGFLLRSRQLAGVVPQDFDVLTINLAAGGGFLGSQRFYGGDGGNLPTSYSSLCNMAEPVGDPQFRADHTWSDGSLASSKWIDPCDDSAVLSVADATIHPATGLPSAVRDASGFETELAYDNMGRLVTEKPEEGAWSNSVFKFPKVGQSTPDIPSVQIETCPHGQAGCSGLARGSSRYKEFDGLGRLSREALALPVEGNPQQNQDRKFTYNALGWKLKESTWQQQKETTFSGHDRFGRVGNIQPPGTNPAIAVSYHGERRTIRKTRIELTAGLTDNWVAEDRDHFGRLVAVCEALSAQPLATGCSGLLTTYSYDAADRLTGVCSRANGVTCGQTRSFTYDGRGFLLSETHPETGPSGNGATTYQYDSLGHVTHSTVAGSADFELRSSYDRAGRLVFLEQKSGTTWKPLKEFFYARDSDGINWQGGKLVLSKRHNWVSSLEALGNIDAVVTDEFRYEGTGGRPSHKTTSFRFLSSTNAFESSYFYDDFGNLETIVYPEPLNWPLSRFSPPRQVDYGYKLGFLASVEGYAPQITYQLGGMLHQVDYQSGASWTQNFNSNDHLPRPFNITLTGVGSGFSTGNFFYDGQSNISQIGSLLYRYDRLGRMVRGDTPNGAGTASQTAAYDDFGNLISLTTAGSVQALPTAEATNRLTAATYDAAGNVTILPLPGSTWTYNFDGLRKMISLRSTSNQARLFFYDANDERIFAWDCPQSSCNPDHDFERWTLRGLGGEVLRSFSGTDKFATVWEEDFIYRGGGDLLASIRPGSSPGQEERRYAAVDHLGSVRQIFSEQNQSLDRFDFHPFGQESGTVAPGEIALKFTGHERDPNGTGKGLLDYMHARYCSPVTSRFLSVDPVLGKAGFPQSRNRYSYALNNPVKFTDPNGKTPKKAADAAEIRIQEIKHDVSEVAFGLLPMGTAIEVTIFSGTLLDLAATLLDPLRAGDALGNAIGSDASGGEITLALVQDAGRTLALAGGAGGAAGKALNVLKPLSLEARAAQIHEVLHPIAQTQRTTAVLQTNGLTVVGGGARDLSTAQRAALIRGEVAARLPGAHAEVTVLEHAMGQGLTPQRLAVTRAICPVCAAYIESTGGKVIGPTTASW